MIIRYREIVFRKASKKPGAPAGGLTDANHTPTGWERRFSDRSGQGSTWISRRTVTWSTDTGFVEATAWGDARALISRGARDSVDSESVYRQGTSTPSAPTGGLDTNNHVPSGWTHSRLNPTLTDNVYRSTRTVYYTYIDADTPEDGEEFSYAEAWTAPTLFRSKTATASTGSISASASSVVKGSSVRISWRTNRTNTATIYGPGFTSGGENVPQNTSGSRTVTVTSASNSWTLFHRGSDNVYRSANVTVRGTDAPTPPTPTAPTPTAPTPTAPTPTAPTPTAPTPTAPTPTAPTPTAPTPTPPPDAVIDSLIADSAVHSTRRVFETTVENNSCHDSFDAWCLYDLALPSMDQLALAPPELRPITLRARNTNSGTLVTVYR